MLQSIRRLLIFRRRYPMAKQPRQTIALLFLGGSVIDERGRKGDQVVKPSDVDPWMAQMAEMDIIAATEGFFIASDRDPIGLGEWAKVAESVRRLAPKFDGFTLVHDLATLPAAAVVLAHMLENLEKPVVVVGSPLRLKRERRSAAPPLVGAQEFGAKASIINAVQVAASDIAEVAVVFGSTIFRGRTVSPTVAPSPTLTGTVLGKIDFGTRLFGEQIKRAKRAFRIHPAYDTDVAVVDFVPGLDTAALTQHTQHHRSFFLSSSEGLAFTEAVLKNILAVAKTAPVALYAPTLKREVPAGILVLRDPSRTAALLRWMWALGQTHDPKKLKKLLIPKEPN